MGNSVLHIRYVIHINIEDEDKSNLALSLNRKEVARQEGNHENENLPLEHNTKLVHICTMDHIKTWWRCMIWCCDDCWLGGIFGPSLVEQKAVTAGMGCPTHRACSILLLAFFIYGGTAFTQEAIG